MHNFTLRELKNADIETELNRIGFDKSYAKRAVEKYEYKNIKIYSLTPAQANILKQTALSAGCDCATHREVITGKIEKSDCILTGSVSQIEKISEKLKFQPFGLKELGCQMQRCIDAKMHSLLQRGKNTGCRLGLPARHDANRSPLITGILNLTSNSFSDGGMYNGFENAKKHLLEMIENGADIIDIGAESTKPYSQPVSAKEQLEKLLPVIDFAKGKIPLSVDTRSAEVAEECIKAGVNIINDVSGFDYDDRMADIIAKYNAPVIIQHSKGNPGNMQDKPQYDDVIEEIYLSLKMKIDFAHSKGVENIIIDPGIGFGKTQKDNFEIIKRVEEFRGLGYPVMLGISRKSLLGMPDESNEVKDIYTTALNAIAIMNKVDIIRVHNVKMHKKLIDLMRMFMIE